MVTTLKELPLLCLTYFFVGVCGGSGGGGRGGGERVYVSGRSDMLSLSTTVNSY